MKSTKIYSQLFAVFLTGAFTVSLPLFAVPAVYPPPKPPRIEFTPVKQPKTLMTPTTNSKQVQQPNSVRDMKPSLDKPIPAASAKQ